MTIQLQAEARNGLTHSDLKTMRGKGKIPGVVYGKKVNSTPIFVDEKQLMSLLKSNARQVVELEVAGVGKHPVMINDMQRDRLSRSLLHIDFHQINMDEPVRTNVAIELMGESKGEQEGGLVSILNHELEIRCLPNQIPQSIQVDVSNLAIGESVLVRDLQVPQGIEVKTDPEIVIVTILMPQKEQLNEEPPTAEEVKETERNTPAEETVHMS